MAVLELGTSPVSRLAIRAGIKRPTAYHYLESLINKGFVYQTTKGKRKLYGTHNPQKLLELMEQRNHQLVSLLPQLTSLY